LHRFCKNDARKKKDSFSGVSLHAVCPGGDLLRGAANLLKYRDLMRKEGGRLLPLQVHGEQTQDRDPLLIALAAINGVFYSESIQTLQAKPGLRNAVRLLLFLRDQIPIDWPKSFMLSLNSNLNCSQLALLDPL
jgi:hypothetical protein